MAIQRGGKRHRFARREAGGRKGQRHRKMVVRRIGYDGARSSNRHPGCLPFGSGREKKKREQHS